MNVSPRSAVLTVGAFIVSLLGIYVMNCSVDLRSSQLFGAPIVAGGLVLLVLAVASTLPGNP